MHNFAQTFVKLCKTAQTTRQMQKFAIIENEKRCSFLLQRCACTRDFGNIY